MTQYHTGTTTQTITALQGGTWSLSQPPSVVVTPGTCTFTTSSSFTIISGTISVYEIRPSFVVTPGSGTFVVSSSWTIISGTVTVSEQRPSFVITPGSGTFVVSSSWTVVSGTVTIIASGTLPVSSTATTITNSTITISAPANNTIAIPVTYPSTPTIRISEIAGSTFGASGPGYVQFITTQTVAALPIGTQTISGMGSMGVISTYTIISGTVTVYEQRPSFVITPGSGTLTTSSTYTIVIGTVTVFPTFPNRTTIIFSTSSYLSETTSGGSPMTFVKTTTMTITSGTTVTTASKYTVTTGKTLRLQTCYFNGIPNIPSTTVTFASTTLYGLIGADANRQAGKNIFTLSFLMQTNIDTPPSVLTWPDGLELPAGTVFSLAHQASAGTIREEYSCVGYEY